MKSKKNHNFEKVISCAGLCISLVFASAVSAAETESITEAYISMEEMQSKTAQGTQTEIQEEQSEALEAQEEKRETQEEYSEVQKAQIEMPEAQTETGGEQIKTPEAQTEAGEEQIEMPEAQTEAGEEQIEMPEAETGAQTTPTDTAQETEVQETEIIAESETEPPAMTQENATETMEEELIVGEENFQSGTQVTALDETTAKLPEEAESDLPNTQQMPLDVPSGVCGVEDAAVSWQLQNGVLTISGMGEMISWESAERTPWYEYCDVIIKVAVEEGVTSVGANAFYGFTGIREISLADSVTSIGAFAFFGCDGLDSLSLG